MSIFADAIFNWHPGSSDSVPWDAVSGEGTRWSQPSNGQGVLSTVDSRPFRTTYGTDIGSKFKPPSSLTSIKTDFTFFAMARETSGSGHCFAAQVCNSTDLDRYAELRINNNGNPEGYLRLDAATTPGNSDFPFAAVTLTSTSFVPLVMTLDASDASNGTLTLYGGSASNSASDTWSSASPADIDTIAIGHLGDSSPTWSASTAGIMHIVLWDRVLSTGEIAWIFDHPYAGIDELLGKVANRLLVSQTAISSVPIRRRAT